jgi:hypothetical protein
MQDYRYRRVARPPDPSAESLERAIDDYDYLREISGLPRLEQCPAGRPARRLLRVVTNREKWRAERFR